MRPIKREQLTEAEKLLIDVCEILQLANEDSFVRNIDNYFQKYYATNHDQMIYENRSLRKTIREEIKRISKQ